MLLSTQNYHQSRKKSSVNLLNIEPLTISNYSSRHSLASPGNSILMIPETATGILKGRKSSAFSINPPKESQGQSLGLMTTLAIGKMKYKAEQTKQFIKSETNPRRNLLDLSIHDSEIAKVFYINFDINFSLDCLKSFNETCGSKIRS